MSHYGDHLASIWRALPLQERGTWWAPDRDRSHLLGLGVDRHVIRHGRPADRGTACVVASAGDAATCGDRSVVLVEHGAGQGYDKANPSYSGGPGRHNVVLFLCPNEVSAQRNRDSYPGSVVDVVGSPRLDELLAKVTEPVGSMVALSFHWDCPLVPETKWAYPWFKRALPDVACAFPTIGHGHPRYAAACANAWRKLGIEHVPDFSDVIRRARLYVCDNSSSLYEWAALDRPVVVLNAPWYRRDVDLWPRFWACADVGVQCDNPADLIGAVHTALEDPPVIAARRAEIVDEVFPLRDGRAAVRSVEAIHAVLGG